MLAREVREHQPTLLVAPSLEDRHPDYSAVGLLLELLFTARPDLGAGIAQWLIYSIHGGPVRTYAALVDLRLSPVEHERKRRAIAAHASQLVLRGSFYRSFASAHEVFEDASIARRQLHPVEVVADARSGLPPGLRLGPGADLFAAGKGALLVTGIDLHERPFAAVTSARDRWVTLPASVATPLRRLFFKRASRWWLFDKRGWREARLPSAEPITAPALAFAR